MSQYNKRLVGGFCSLAVGSILTLVCCVIYGWCKTDNTIFSLWRFCVTIGGEEHCASIEEESGMLDATRRLIITSIIHSGIASLMTIYFLIKTKGTGHHCSKSTVWAILIAGLIGGVLQIIASILYGASYKDDYGSDYDLAHAFFMHLFATLCVICGCIAVFISYKKTRVGDGGQVIAKTTVMMHTYPTAGHQGAPAPNYGFQPPPPYGAPVYPVYGQQPAGYGFSGQPQQPGYPPASAPYGGQPTGGPQLLNNPNPAFPPPPQMSY